MTFPARIAIATRNAHKVHEIRAICAEWPVTFVDADDRWPVVEETGATYLENAFLKARAVGQLDYDGARDRAQAFGQGQQAVKMIAEFEEHGTGWFWESDRQGRLTYLSRKVADDLVQTGQPHPIGQFLTDVFRMDGAAIGTERTLAFHLSSRTAFADYMICGAGDASSRHCSAVSRFNSSYLTVTQQASAARQVLVEASEDFNAPTFRIAQRRIRDDNVGGFGK